MATETAGVDLGERPARPRRRSIFTAPPERLGWGAIFCGAIVALAVYALLYAFGLAVGLSAIDPNSVSSLRGSGIFTGIWSLIVPIVALFIGGAVASRGTDVMTRLGGALHGLAVWGLVTVAGVWLLTNVLLGVVGGAGRMAAWGGTTMLGAMGSGPGGASPTAMIASQYEAAAAEGLAPLNQRLQAEGRPRVTVDQLQPAVTLFAQEALRGGDVNRESLVQTIMGSTTLGRADAEQLAGRMIARYDAARQSAQTAALQAADATGKAFWGVFGVLFLSLISALAGSMIGVSKRPRYYVTPASPAATPPLVSHEVPVHP